MAVVVIGEDWIRDRVQIKHENLDDVRSLSLPGTYHEKISSFGDSLKHFCRLKSLDVSRNAIESLSGLENLKLLEKLNLYYNCIGTLDELSKLRVNNKLQELDLRLNPVSRTEPDYRLFLVHMLPELRLLDDRAVRDTERKAALIHFSSDQAVQFTSHPERPQSPKQKPNPRVEHVKSLGKMQLYYTEDEALLSEMIRTGGDFSRKVFTGSVQKTPFSDDYSPEVIRQMNKGFLTSDAGDLPTTMKSYQDVRDDEVTGDDKGAAAQFSQHCTGSAFGANVDEIQSKYPNLYPFIISASGQSKLRDQSSSLNMNRMQNPNADTSTEAMGHFTPNPAMFEKMEISHKSPGTKQYMKAAGGNVDGVTGYEFETYKDGNSDGMDCLPQSREILPPCPAAPRVNNDGSKSSDSRSLDCDNQLIIKISDLADKYWNGSRSLLKNQRFRNNITDFLRSIQIEQTDKTDSTGAGDPLLPAGTASSSSNLFLQRQLDQLRSELSRSRDENMRLHEKLVAVTMDSGLGDDIGSGELPPDETKLKSSLIKAQRDTSILRSRLEQVNEEKKALNDIIARLQATVPQPKTHTKNQGEIEMILSDNDRLRSENHLLRNRLAQSSPPMLELSSMLQDSHRSLVQTNEHLLQELNQLKRYRGDEKSRLGVSH